MSDEIARMERGQKASTLVYVDLNKFKEINDKYGHKVGDNALVEFSQQMKSNIDTEDKERDYHTFQASSQSCTLDVNNGLWAWLTNVSLKIEKIICHRIPANHNILIPQLANEITNKILKNPMQVDFKERFHAENMSHNMHCLLTYNKKVCDYYVYKL